MDRCQLFQDLLLEYLYDLLEGHERQSLETHLAGCPACQAALVKAKNQQRLLATAAKAEFAGVRFQAPASDDPAPVVVSMPVRSPRRRFVRYAMAAALLLAVCGVAGSALWLRQDYQMAQGVVEEHQVALAGIEKKEREVQQQIESLPAQRQARLNEITQKINEKQFRVTVIGPQSVQAGAPNEYRIETVNLNNQPAPTRLEARVRDASGKELYARSLAELSSEHRLVLPPSLPLTPGSKPTLEIVARKDDTKGELKHQLDLVAPLYVTHLATDKPMYQPGETVHFRSLTLERFSLKPPDEALNLIYTLVQPSGAMTQLGAGSALVSRQNPQNGQVTPILGPDKKPVRGIGAGDFYLAPGMSGGEYTLRVSEQANRFLPQERKFIVNQYQAHKLDKKLDFSKKSYGPGEAVSAACEAKRAGGGGEVANRPVEVAVKVDNIQYGPDGKPSNQPIRFQTDAKGKVVIRFKLPAAIQTGDGTVSVTFNDGGNTETMVKPIPIVLKKLDVQFFPEGGDLVAGVPNRVYFQVRNTRGKPADLKGHVVNQDQKTVVEQVQTLTDAEEPGVNQGLGVFTFTPQTASKFELKIDSPAGMEGVYRLPEIKEDGVVLTIPQGVTTAREPIVALVRSARADRKLLVGAYCRGRLLDHKTITARKGEEVKVELTPAVGAGGVYRVTVFEQRGDDKQRNFVPMAERLVYRQPAEHLFLTAKPDKRVYVPGDRVKLNFSALDEQEKPASAILLVGVVDKSVVTMADEKTRRAMPTHFLMTSEVKKPEDLEYADFLVGSHPKAPAALDLLLGTQGWRRFAEQDPTRFKQRQADEADRLLVSIGQSDRPRDLEQSEQEKVAKEIAAQETHLQEERRDLDNRLQELTRADVAYFAAIRKVTGYDEWLKWGRQMALPLAALLLVLLAVIPLVAAIRRTGATRLPYLLATAACGVLACILLVNHLATERLGSDRVAQETSAVPKLAEPGAMPDDAKLGRPMPMEKREAPAEPLGEKLPAIGYVGKPKAMPPAPKNAAMPAPAAADPNAALERFNVLGDKDKKADGGKDFQLKFQDKAELHDAAKGEAKRLEMMRAGGAMRAPAGMGGPGMGGMQGGFGGRMGGRGMPPGMGGGGAMPAAPFGVVEGAQGGIAPLELQQEMRKQAGDGKEQEVQFRRFARDRALASSRPAPLPPFIVREYAHTRTHGNEADRRTDASETVYWNPVFVLADGKGDATFDLSDQVTSFEVTVYGHTLDGRLGALTTDLESRLPLTLEPKTPIEVTANDKIDIPLAVANNTDKTQAVQIDTAFKGLTLVKGQPKEQLQLAADQRLRRVYRLQPSLLEGEAEVTFRGESKPFAADSIRRTFRVVPDGFPIVASRSDLLEGSATNEVVLPETWIKDTLKLGVSVYPSTLADLQKGLDALLREPNGCFEQTSTTNYPNLLILDYLKQSDQTKPEIEKRARDLLSRGYQKLVAFECPRSAAHDRMGFEWFGSPDQQHEALTAYGLLQFRDLSRVMDVDQNLIQRTRSFLLAQRDGKGGFKRNPRALDTFGRAPENITNAYIVWAITSSGQDDDVTAEITALGDQARDSKDPYFLALVANSLINRGKSGDAMDLLKKLAAAQQADGHLDAERTSITGSGGRDLQIETTALTVLAWLKGNPGEFNPNIRKAINWIGQQRGGYGGFGSTQSTILALKALIEHAKANKKTPEAGTLSLFVGDRLVGKLDFPADARDALEIKLADAENVLKSGKNTVRVEITGHNAFPYTLSWSYQTLQPTSDPACPVHLTTKLDRTKAQEGETVTLNVSVENPADEGRSMVVAIVGLPAGLTLPEDMKQLKEYVRLQDNGTKPGRISYFETRGRELILYWRGMAPKQKVEVPIELICRVPGEYRGPASRAYQYYNADHKHWVEPLAVSIAPKSE